MKNLILILSTISLFSTSVFAWGGRGHDEICQSATFLVKNVKLKDFLLKRAHMMGHLCNVPDIYWRNLSKEQTEQGNAAHYINSEFIGLKISEISTDLNAVIKKYTGVTSQWDQNKTIDSVPIQLGTLWWRAQQLHDISLDSAQKISKSEKPKDKIEEQSESLSYNQSIYNMMVAMGIMGHFVGDNSQPYHVTTDYDGYAIGHGGIHSYYEEESVAQLPPDLKARIVKKASQLKNKKFLDAGTVVDRMKRLSIISYDEIKDVIKKDPIIRPSTIKVENQISTKVPATRRSPLDGAKNFESLITTEMARSASLLAQLWDDIYRKAGEPDLSAYRSYRYPLMPDFIMPDYYEIKKPTATH